jgi:hypothetical protein
VTNSISGVQRVVSASNVFARYSANLYQTRIEMNLFPTQQAYIVINTPYLYSARARFGAQLAHSLLTEMFRDFFFGPYGKFIDQVTSANFEGVACN